MVTQTLTTRIVLRNDISDNWVLNNPILLKGEMGIEINTGKFKFGDSVTTWSLLQYASAQQAILYTRPPSTTDSTYDVGSLWIDTLNKKAYHLFDNTANNALWKQIITPEDLSDIGGGDMMKSQFAINAKSSLGYVDKSIESDKLTTARTITLDGDVSAVPIPFDATENITLSTVLANVVTAGTYPKITFNAKGLVVGFEILSVPDVPDLPMSKITDAGSAATRDVGNSIGNVVLVESNGKINDSLLPSLAITDIYSVVSEAEMLALIALQGDIAIRTDINKTFILRQSPANVLENWLELKTPTAGITMINGKTGASITITTSDIDEGSNLYYTEDRATENFNTNISSRSSTDLLDGETIMHSSDTFILNGGKSQGW